MDVRIKYCLVLVGILAFLGILYFNSRMQWGAMACSGIVLIVTITIFSRLVLVQGESPSQCRLPQDLS